MAHFLSILIVTGLVWGAISATAPNYIVFILSDDHGFHNVGFRNDEYKRLTPALDALAASGRVLERHYTYKMCSPSRASFISGRLPIHVNQENSASEQPRAGVLEEFTTFPERLREANYRSHQVGKWHCGQASTAQTPLGRGFNTSLGYFNFGEDHYTQLRGGQATQADRTPVHTPGNCGTAVDLWKTHQPAYGLNGTYGGTLYRNEALRVVSEHPRDQGLFLFLALQNNHAPLQVPDAYPVKCRQQWGYKNETQTFSQKELYCGMTTFSDETIGMVVTALKQRGFWDSTLLVFSSDNGGWLQFAGDNTPLRGGKFSDLEGGTRVLSLVAGGLLPKAVQGTPVTGYVAICDWYATFLGLAGVHNVTDNRAAAAGLPPVDSLDMWNLISGTNITSPRTEIPLSAKPPDPVKWHGWWANDYYNVDAPGAGYYLKGEGLIVGDWKLVIGEQQEGPFSRQGKDLFTDCGPGCLYNIKDDPCEKNNLNVTHPEILQQMQARQEYWRKTVFAPNRGDMDPRACTVIKENGGYYAPWL